MNNIDIGGEFVLASQAMREIWDGESLLRAAHQVIAAAPPGRVTFVTTSTEGAALAAVCATLRGDGSSWRRVNLLAPAPTLAGTVVFVEPVLPGRVWRDAVERHHPEAVVVVPTGKRGYRPIVASAAAAA